MPENEVRAVQPEKEKLTMEVGKSKFHYRRIKTTEKAAIDRANTKIGELDGESAGLDYIKLCLIGWENVLDWDGKQFPYSKENIESLPINVLTRLTFAIVDLGGTNVEKNSSTGLAS